MTVYGFLGLGQMGGPMAARLAASGVALAVYDKAGTQARAPSGVRHGASEAEIAALADTVFLSLPDGGAVLGAIGALASAPVRRARAVVDLSTIGISASEEAAGACAAADLAFLDAPVSGGAAGARRGTLAVMAAGKAELFESLRPAFLAMAKNLFHVGTRPGQGQAMKLLNNFLSGTAMAATSEAVIFGEANGLEMKTMLDVLNVSTGQNTATADKFPNRVLTGSFDAGFAAGLMHKDVRLYAENVRKAGTASEVSTLIEAIWRRVQAGGAGTDFTRIYHALGGKSHRR